MGRSGRHTVAPGNHGCERLLNCTVALMGRQKSPARSTDLKRAARAKGQNRTCYRSCRPCKKCGVEKPWRYAKQPDRCQSCGKLKQRNHRSVKMTDPEYCRAERQRWFKWALKTCEPRRMALAQIKSTQWDNMEMRAMRGLKKRAKLYTFPKPDKDD